jgi:Fe-S oxidoreductase
VWACTSCKACDEICPVNIEILDKILDMRRYLSLMESDFPTELGTAYRSMENSSNPWGMSQSDRADWAGKLDGIQIVDGSSPLTAEFLYWVGCAGSFDDKNKKVTQAMAQLMQRAEIDFAILGPSEMCTGDPARRSGNEYVFQMLAMQNIETMNGMGVRKIITQCPHCFNTLGNEYEQLGLKVEVVHHTQLLAHLVKEGKLTPVEPIAGDVTYHDPCYLGRHNEIYEDPRALVGAAGATLSEMPRHADRSMCCGAGGARMWMEERIGQRVNVNRTTEALDTLADAGGEQGTIAVGCPFCRTMLTDGLTQAQGAGSGENVQVQDVSQLLLAAVKRGAPTEDPEDAKS